MRPSSDLHTKTLACEHCRRGKLKCDRIKPCASCKTRGLEEQCYQGGNAAIRSSNEPVLSNAEVTKALQGQQRALSSLVNLIQGDVQSQSMHRDGQAWQEEVEKCLPSLQDCNILLDFCYTNLPMLGLLIDRDLLIQTFHRLQRHSSVDRTEAALLLIVLAAAALMMPVAHPLQSRLTCSPQLEHSIWLILADRIKSYGRLLEPSPVSEIVLIEITLEMAFVMYFNHAGQEDKLWEVLGIAIRKGASISLFDERHALWKDLSQEDRAKRKKLGLSIALVDAWTSFNRMRQPGIHLTSFRLSFQDAYCQEGILPLLGELDPRQLPIIHRCHNFIFSFDDKSNASRYVEASMLCDEIKTTSSQILTSMGITIPIDVLPSHISSVPEDQRAALLVCVSTSSYSACMVTRRFLTDPDAPLDLRFVSLQHAQNILATIPVVTAIMQDKRLPINPSWNANQLLCAATIFAVMLMGRDSHFDLNTFHSSMETDNSEPTSAPIHLIQEQLDWLSAWIFDILECLKVIQESTGNRSAMLCLRMLQGMCRVDKHLQEASRRRYGSTEDTRQTTTQRNEVQDLIDLIWASKEEAEIASEILRC